MFGNLDEVRLMLEEMKMQQGSLKQIMTLSAGGLALYFSFIIKVPFLSSSKVVNILIVLSWIISLSSAIKAHFNYADLFNNILYSTLSIQRKLTSYDEAVSKLHSDLDK